MEIVFEDERVAVERGVEGFELLERGDHGLDKEGQHRDFDAGRLGVLVRGLTKDFDIGDVSLVEVRDVRDRHPIASEVDT